MALRATELCSVLKQTAMLTKTNTSWNASLYDDKHSFVFKYGEDLISMLAPQAGERILDLGCGTGHLTQQISLTGARVTGIDSSAAMIDKASAIFPDIDFRVMSATDFDLDETFDAVFSNAALHWMKPPGPVAETIARALKPGGRLVAEMGGHGNIAKVLDALRSVLGEDLVAERVVVDRSREGEAADEHCVPGDGIGPAPSRRLLGAGALEEAVADLMRPARE